jgi:thiol-disulfide isomerase/thioredoxin
MKVIKITAVWCSACLIMNKRWKEIEKEYDFETISYDLDFDEDEVKEYEVGEKLPVFIFLDGDKEIGRLIGEKSLDQIREYIEELK